MRLKIRHLSRYTFDEPVTFALQQVRKTPKSSGNQHLRTWETTIAGGQKEVRFEDHHNNVTELVSFQKDTTAFEVICEGEVDMTENHGVVGRHHGPAPLWLYLQPTALTEAKSGVRELVRHLEGEAPLDRLHALSRTVAQAVSYEIGASHAAWSAEDALEAGAGVCQDHAHVFLACARALGFPARYVSGYLMLNDRTTQDAMHAWAEAHVEGLGWVGFDVSNGISPDTRYVRVATGMDYSDAAPISGMQVGGSGETLSVEIEVAQQ